MNAPHPREDAVRSSSLVGVFVEVLACALGLPTAAVRPILADFQSETRDKSFHRLIHMENKGGNRLRTRYSRSCRDRPHNAGATRRLIVGQKSPFSSVRVARHPKTYAPCLRLASSSPPRPSIANDVGSGTPNNWISSELGSNGVS